MSQSNIISDKDKNKNETEEKIVLTPSKSIIQKGEEILDSHEFYKDLSELMEDPKFTKFFDKYFKTMNDTKVTLVYMNLYKEFKSKYKELNDKELDKRINIFLIWKMMKDRDINKFALHTVLNHMDNPKKTNILDEFQRFIKTYNLLENK